MEDEIEKWKEKKSKVTYLTKLGATSLTISTKHPRITKTRSIFPSTHGFTSITTSFRSAEFEFRTPFHSWTPKLQMFNPFTAPSNNILTNQNQRRSNSKLWNRSASASCYSREENIGQTARNQKHQKKNQTVW